jgi:peptidoglycan/xylan/chitin deacetylase (PgdA/CDA1 family)
MNMPLVRACVAGVSRAVGLLHLVEQNCRDRLTILTYHRVLPQERRERYPLPDLVITPETFRQHCRILGRHFRVLPLVQAMASWTHGTASARPIAAITSDEAIATTSCMPRRYWRTGLRATFFVITGWSARGSSVVRRLGRALALSLASTAVHPRARRSLGAAARAETCAANGTWMSDTC